MDRFLSPEAQVIFAFSGPLLTALVAFLGLRNKANTSFVSQLAARLTECEEDRRKLWLELRQIQKEVYPRDMG